MKFLENSNARRNIRDVSGTGIIIGENIKTGDININVVYESAKNYGLMLLPNTYFRR